MKKPKPQDLPSKNQVLRVLKAIKKAKKKLEQMKSNNK